MTAYVVRADHGRNATPHLRYWHADTGRWGDYDTATRYNQAPTVTRTIVDALGSHSHPVDVSVIQAHGVDVDGYPYTDSSIGPIRLTHCCVAVTSTDGGPLYCKSCFAEVDWDYDGPARLTPDAAPLVCPECQEPAHPVPPREWLLSDWKPRPRYSHPDATPLCPVYGPDGAQPAEPVPAPDTPTDD